MQKIRAASVADLVRMADRLGIRPATPQQDDTKVWKGGGHPVDGGRLRTGRRHTRGGRGDDDEPIRFALNALCGWAARGRLFGVVG